MNKETKIGLLTGLGVIIIIGVLLSEYLGTPGVVRGAGSVAPLSQLGDTYRQRVMQPVGVEPVINPEANALQITGPSVASADAPAASQPLANAGTPPTMLAMSGAMGNPQVTRLPDDMTPAAAAPIGTSTSMTTGQPVQQAVYVAATGGPVLTPGNALTGPQGETLTMMAATAPAPAAPVASAPAPIAGTTYVVSKGDTLTAIAKKFYHSSSHANQQKIVAANPTLFKDVNSPLKIGMKVLVPDAPKPVVAKAPVTPMPANANGKAMVIKLPASGSAKNTSTAATGTAAKRPTTYTVVSGDTLAKIAHKVMGSGSHANIVKLAKLNGFDADDTLDVGEVLHIPAQ